MSDSCNITDMELLRMFRKLSKTGRAKAYERILSLIDCGNVVVDPDAPKAEIISFTGSRRTERG